MRAPPRLALHGPFKAKGEADRLHILAGVEAGTCRCACCRYHEKCVPLPEAGWMWIRQATPKQKRSGDPLVPSWPLWIYVRP